MPRLRVEPGHLLPKQDVVLIADDAIGEWMACSVMEARSEAIGAERRCYLFATEVRIPQSRDRSRLGRGT